ncbi:MAG: DUF4339 domain-containing protein [Bryobacterales bacterium]|nr:DUF4339 domain-containing protein [Bryobacterales bacterium]
MNYFVQRDQQEYGPYTEGDLSRYLASGHLFPQDLVRRDGEPEIRTLSQLSLPPPAPAIPPGAYAPAYLRPQMANGAPLPPNLHWGLVLLLTLVSCGFFGAIWMLMQGWWLKQLRPGNRSIWLLSASFGVGYAGTLLISAVSPFLDPAFQKSELSAIPALILGGILLLVAIAALALYFIAELAMRREMLDYFNTVENIGLRLNPVLTLLVGMYYLQYHMSRIAEWKKTGALAP